MIFGKYTGKYYKKYMIFFILGIVSLIVVDWIQLYLPEYLGRLVDLFKNDNVDYSILLEYMIKIIFIGLGMLLGRVGWRLTLFYASKHIDTDLRQEMFEKAERLSLNYYHTTKVGTIMSWITGDLETMEEFIGWGTLMLVDGTFLTIFALTKMFLLDWAISLIAIIPIILIAVLGSFIERFMGNKWMLRQESFDRLYDYSQENFSGIRVIKAFVKEEQQIKMFSKVSLINKDMNVSFFKYAVMLDVINEILINSIFALILGLGGYLVYSVSVSSPASLFGENIIRTPGMVIEYIGYFESLIWPMIALGQVITMYSKAKASNKRITAFLDSEEEVHSPINAVKINEVKGKITFKNFSFKYPDDIAQNNQIEDVSLEINPGELIGVVGKVGSGKSTLISSLLRFYNYKKGTVFIDGEDIMDLDITSLRDNIAYVPQDNFLFGISLDKNISYGKENANDEEIINAAKFSMIHESIMDMPNGYNTISGERGQTLSGGQKQRVAIARAAIKDSPIMIMDDSVSAVDVKTEEAIIDNILKMRKGKTTIVIASRISTIKSFDRIIVLNEGRLEAFDSPKNLLKNSPTYKHMVKLQKLEKEVEDHE